MNCVFQSIFILKVSYAKLPQKIMLPINVLFCFVGLWTGSKKKVNTFFSKKMYKRPKNYFRTTALGIGGGRGIEPCAVERSTVANAKPRKARPPQDITVKNSYVFCSLACGGNAQNSIYIYINMHTILLR